MGIRSLCLFSLTLTAFSANADFRICNRSGQVLSVADAVYYLNYAGETRFESHGWNVLADGDCRIMDNHGTRRMWFRAVGSQHSVWDGAVGAAATRMFCIKEKKRFVLDAQRYPGIHTSPSVCAAEGGVLRRFLEIKGAHDEHVANFEKGKDAPFQNPGKDPKPEPKPYPLPDRDPIPPELTGPTETTYGPGEE